MATTSRIGEKRTAVEHLSFDARTAKRVAWEAWEFTVVSPYQVLVTNAAYGYLKDKHAYVVGVEERGGVVLPAECGCPADIHHESDCKHKVALATVAGPTVLNAAVAYEHVKPDGDRKSEALKTDGGLHAADDSCPNGTPNCDGLDGDELPCFDCYSEGV